MTAEAEQRFLIMDQGGQSSRALLLDGQGRCLALARRSVPTHRDGGRVEQDANALTTSLNDCLAELAPRLQHEPTPVAGLTCQRATLVCWDRRSGTPLTPAISWQDTRAAAYLEKLSPALRASLPGRTGMRASPHYLAAKLAWCLDHLPAVRRAADAGRLCAGPLASFLCQALTGEAAAEPTTASRSLLWNRQTGDWDSELLEAFGLAREWLPALAPSRDDFGTCGERLRLPLALVCGDQAAAPWCLGPPDADTLWINLGTGGFLQRWSPQPLEAAGPLLASPSPNGHGELLEGTVNGAAAALQWAAEPQGLSVPQALRRAREVDHPPLFINSIGGLGSPYWHADLTPHYIGPGDATARLRAVAESIAFLLRVNFEHQQALLGPPRRVALTGGLAEAPLMAELIAALLPVPTYRLREPEATARGAAQLLAGTDTPMDWDNAEQLPPGPAEDLMRRYRRWRDTLEGLVRR